MERERENASHDTCSLAVQMYCGGATELNQCDNCIKTYWDQLVAKECREIVLKDACKVIENGMSTLPPGVVCEFCLQILTF